MNLFSDSHLLFVFKPFNIFKNSFCFSFTRPTYEAKADAKINTFTYSLQIFPHFFSNFFRKFVLFLALPVSALLIYHPNRRLSTTFFAFS